MNNKEISVKVIDELDNNRLVFENLFKHKKKEEYLWKPVQEKWCILEILCHLYDEEREDFRARIRHTFEIPSEPLPSIDPESWVKSREYLKRNYGEMLESFLKERELSVNWLRSLPDPDWDSSCVHSKFGRMSAKMILANWLAHDYLHIRQVLKLNFELLKNFSSEELDYAGNW